MRGYTLKTTIVAAGALALMAGSSLAADVPVVTKAPPIGKAPVASPIWDVAFGGLIASDYYFRGISQSNRGPSAGAYVEAQYNSSYGQWYAGLAGWGINWPTTFANGTILGFSDPSAEINFTGGWRHEWGKASADIGFIYYYYPNEQVVAGVAVDSDFWEIYWKGGYAVTDQFSVGASVAYTPDLLNYGSLPGFTTNARGLAAAINASYTYWEQGDWSSAISGELGHWWIKDSGYIALGFADPSYTYWNAGIAWTYKAITLDLRYHGSDLSSTDCGNFLLVGTPHPSNRWCDDRFIATLKFDTSLSALK